MMDRGLVMGSAETRRRFETGEGERGRESDLVRSGHQLGRNRHPLPCGSGQLYNLFSIVIKGIANTANAFFGY